MSAGDRSIGRLRSIELATAAVMTAAAVALLVIGSVIPQAAAVSLLATAPFGLLVQRHRARALAAGCVAGALICFVVLGVGGAISFLCMALLGAFVGALKRRDRGLPTVLASALVIGPGAALVVDALLLVFAPYRELVLDAARTTSDGLTQTLAQVPQLRPAADELSRLSDALLDHWALAVAVLVGLIAVPSGLVASWMLLGAVLDRLDWATNADRLEPIAGPATAALDESPAPLPVALRGVRMRYPGQQGDAIAGVDLVLGEREFLVLIGDNGSGKSTLARILAGAPCTEGTVSRPGRAGLGDIGGTALIQQRPDAQVLGSRVADDVVWGIPPGVDVDVDALLQDVGLGGMGERSTGDLSGGQLQRLAVAAALARRPRLLISDEGTAMIDQQGRAELMALLAALPRRRAMSVVHVTHSAEEAAAADRVIRLSGGLIVGDGPDDGPDEGPGGVAPPRQPRVRTAPSRHAPRTARPSHDILQLRAVGHAYAGGTPWEHTALADIDLSVRSGEGVLIVGDNGSGKSTLAWIVAGLLAPSTGQCLLDGAMTVHRRGAVGLAFQHARLQLQRPTVAQDILDAAGRPPAAAEADAVVRRALRDVGLPEELGAVPVEALSGGQMRRVAIAGLLARGPRVLVLDEPLAGLDPPSRDVLLEVLASLRHDHGMTLLVVSHDTEALAGVCSRIVRLEQGRVVGDDALVGAGGSAGG